MTGRPWLLDRLLAERFGWPRWFFRPEPDDDEDDQEGGKD